MAQPTQVAQAESDTTGQEVKEQVVEGREGGSGPSGPGQAAQTTPTSAPADPRLEKSQNPTAAQPSVNAPLARPSLAPSSSNHVQTSSLTPVAPHPKRFSASNINKKFLEKNTASGSTGSSASSIAKAGSPAARPSIQPTSSHSRLVTTKLTANPAVTSSATGWSRPSSVAPSPATASNSPISTSPLPTAPLAQPSATGAPQLPHVGKVIHPQPRGSVASNAPPQKEVAGGKPVWGNVKPPTVAPLRPDMASNDFPTAAEVANVTSARKQTKVPEEPKATPATAARQLRLEEADAFRGVHLDPNVHHWDEMEEDDDNFLDGVIEFGDGRQYKIESTEQTGASPARGLSRGHADETLQKESLAGPVSKEERFVDDFDRSWPKSRNSPASGSKDVVTSPSVSPVISHSTHSPKDSSRVLFNERSNRLEPYNQTHRPGAFASKRSNHQEGPNLHEPRSAREGSIQVLQKSSGGDSGPRSRRFSAASAGYSSGAPNGYVGDRHRDKEHPSRREGPPPSPRNLRDHPPLVAESSRELDHDRSRRAVGRPPSHFGQKRLQDEGRQLPPHLVQTSPDAAIKRLPSRERRFPPEHNVTEPQSTSTGVPPHSPAVSHTSLSVPSPASATNATLPLTPVDLDVARKDVMHTAAERAKQRRQQEEQEREAQKERARRKAAELEEKMKAAEAEKEKEKQKEADEKAKVAAKENEAVKFIENALKSADSITKPRENAHDSTTGKDMQQRSTPSSSASLEPQRAGPLKRATATPSRPAPLPASPALQSESWRTRTGAPQSAAPRQIQPRPPASATFISSGPSAAEQIESIADGSKDDLEVVDFTDMDKFVGVQDRTENTRQSATPAVGTTIMTKPSRPVASDFFEDHEMQESSAVSKVSGYGAWRRKVSQVAEETHVRIVPETKALVVEEGVISEGSKDQHRARESAVSPDSPVTSTKEPLSHQEANGGQTVQLPQSIRSPRNQSFHKESAMSSLDDAMSRIKGVLVGMHAETPKESVATAPADQDLPSSRANLVSPQIPVRLAPKERWVPPALRQRSFDDTDEPREIFLVTILQPPNTPPSTKHIVRLPTVSRQVEYIPKRQLHAFLRPPFQARMDILSFDPPIHDMNRRDLSINDVLFRRPPPGFKGKYKYRVVLPRRRGPKVNVPSLQGKSSGIGAFGRPTVADGAASWRKSVAPIIPAESAAKASGLDTTSRSPPPQTTPPGTNVASIPKSGEANKSDPNSNARPRSQPKMPEGSAVAFLRDSRVDVVEAGVKPLVNFIVGSQLEEVASPASAEKATSKASDGHSGHTLPMNGTSSGDEGTLPSSSSNKAESSDASNGRLITSPSHQSSTPWARSSLGVPVKDSSARAPDPEQIKALWSQTSNKSNLHSVNSLEGIADDLTSLPFTIQDVKSEDGETPPPTLPSAPSRMSLHEVTRAFQTVPTSSSSSTQSSHRATFSPPSTNAPVARPTAAAATASYAYSPVPQNGMRPAYVPYPSPMMSHSPSPVIYGHPMASSPVPSRMQVNGHTPLYSQPMWMTVPGPTPQAPGNMIRPVASPYPPAQMMPYPAPGYAPQPPPPGMMHTPPQGQAGGRGRGIPVLSPVMSHAHSHPASAMYASSPVMLHAVQIPQSHSYMPVSAGRGQPTRTENGQMPPQQHQPHNNHQTPSHSGFHPAPTSFVRSAW